MQHHRVMTTQTSEAAPTTGPQWHSPIERLTTTTYLAAASIVVSPDTVLPVDPTAREIEIPRGSVLFEHLARSAQDGGTLYLTRDGRRIAGVVPADVAESLEGSEPDDEPGAGIRELLAEAESRVGPVPPEIAAEVDRQWAAAAALAVR
jgi:hypothetical protein